MTRTQVSVSSVAVLLLAALVAPACSSTNDDGPSGPSCTNGIKDDNEEGTDCGSACPAKCTGATCTKDEECGSGKCNAGACAAPAGKPCGVGAPVPTCNDGEKCELDKDCTSGFCDANTCKTASAESHTDGKKNSGETGIDCGGSVKATAPCPDGQGCIDSTDCIGTCTANVCGPKGPKDGKKDNDETDVDCGGKGAPPCDVGKACLTDDDCKKAAPDYDYCSSAKKCTAPTSSDGLKNGTETDVDCGGTGPGTVKKCLEGKACLVDGDCNAACNYAKKCIDVPSCKQHFGGDTCGRFEDEDAFKGHVIKSAASGLSPDQRVAAGHESCCRTLPVAGFSDAQHPGKTVYVDKYEITAGRMRAFVEYVKAQNGGVPKIKEYTAAHRPAVKWNNGWEDALPNANTGTIVNFTTTNPTVNLLYPGQDQYLINNWIQNTWSVLSGNFQYDIGLVRAMNSPHFFPEYYTDPNAGWPAPDYAASHDLNCSNAQNSYGYSTYWFDTASIAAATGEANVLGKYFSQDQLDQKSLNCTPFGLFAAFCAWDGGQLMTAEAFDYLAGGPFVVPCAGNAPNNPSSCLPDEQPRLAGAKSFCGPASAPNSLLTYSDGTQTCSGVYYYPNDMGHDHHDASSRIGAPGRVLDDTLVLSNNDEPWMDLKGGLVEGVFRAGETERFAYRGFGVSYGSIVHHRNQQTTPRNKGGTFGARCMRFK